MWQTMSGARSMLVAIRPERHGLNAAAPQVLCNAASNEGLACS